MRRLAISAAILGLAVCRVTGAAAEVPDLIPVQGVLTDEFGDTIDGWVDIRFAIYDTETGAGPIWSELYSGSNQVDVLDGFFTVYLGSLNSLLFEDLLPYPELWLGITVGADEEMDRIRLASVPFAEEARFCRQIGDMVAEDIQPTLDFSCGGDQFLRGWEPDGGPVCDVDVTSTGADGGTLTDVYAGAGLDKDWVAGNPELSVVFGNTAGTVAEGNHDHADEYSPVISGGPCGNGYFVSNISASGVISCTAEDTGATYTAGYGLDLASDEFSVDTDLIQVSLSGACNTGEFVSSINPTSGSFTCSTPPDTNAQTICTAGQYLSGDGSCTSLPENCSDCDTHNSDLYWALSGNSGTNPSFDAIGTTDDTTLRFQAGGFTAARYIPHNDSNQGSTYIGGYEGNRSSDGAVSAFIGGGGYWVNSTQEYPNVVFDDFGVVAGGSGNEAGDGDSNPAAQSYASVGGGDSNRADGMYATVGGGFSNRAGGIGGTVGGGYDNTVYQSNFSVVAGGNDNYVENEGTYNSILGGDTNEIMSGTYSTIGGGQYNSCYSGDWATVPGGYGNLASGTSSFAHGYRARAEEKGCWVWSDQSDTTSTVNCGNPNRFIARAAGGVYFYTNSAMSSGVYVGSGGGSWNNVSDRNKKESFERVDTSKVLDKLAAIPVTTWKYKSEPDGVRHMGPVAQDFGPAFGLGDDELSIATVDADGVALAAIIGLNEKLERENLDLRVQNAALSSRVDSLEQRMERIESNGRGSERSELPFDWMSIGALGLGVVLLVGSSRFTRRRGR
ncbi:MAG: tail fiber domain-containing protein [Polyangia bacterium]